MARVQFVETVTIPGGPGGTLIPLAGVAATPYNINSDGTEGTQATAYISRTSLTTSSLITDANGTVSFWLNAGDYNVHIDDQQSPPRITSYIRGFTAPIIDTSQLVVAAQNLIQFTGDTKFSLQTADHGLKPDGTYEWLIVKSEVDGGGRKFDHSLYPGLHALIGSPTPDGLGMVRLPNISGRALVAAGAATGLSSRNLLDFVGEENHLMTIAEMAAHTHTDSGHTHTDSGHGHTDSGHNHGSATVSDPGHHHVVRVGGDYEVPYTLGGWQGVSIASGGTYTNSPDPVSGVISGTNTFADSTTGIGVTVGNGTANIQTGHAALQNGQAAIQSAGSSIPHNNIQPSTCLNLFVKS